MRFTDRRPPPEIFTARPNWESCLDEEGTPGQNESTIRPARQQRYITHDLDYTAGEVWFPNDEFAPALIGLRDGEPDELIIYEESGRYLRSVLAHV